MISKYNDFILEKQFNEIVSDIFRIVESDGVWTSSNTIEWDLTKKEDKPVDFIDKGIDKLKYFISKLDKEQLKSYYIKLVNKLKSLPAKMRKFLLRHYTSAFLSVVSLSYLVSGTDSSIPNLDKEKKTKTEIVNKVDKIDPEIKKEIIELHKGSSFEEAQSAVKEVEAGYSDDKDDIGNWVDVPGGKRFIGTNHGISAPILQEYLGRIPKREDMENLSYETALKIYKKDYWDAQNLELLYDQSIANIVYDGCVNQGVGGMDNIIKKAAAEQKVNLDGTSYSKSNIEKINGLDQVKLFKSIKKFREERYKQASTWRIHGDGWLNRLSGIEYQNDSDIT